MVKASNLIYTELFLNNRTGDSILFHENNINKTETQYPPKSSPKSSHDHQKLAVYSLYTSTLPYILISPSTKMYFVLQYAPSLLHVTNKGGRFIEEEDTVEWKRKEEEGEEAKKGTLLGKRDLKGFKQDLWKGSNREKKRNLIPVYISKLFKGTFWEQKLSTNSLMHMKLLLSKIYKSLLGWFLRLYKLCFCLGLLLCYSPLEWDVNLEIFSNRSTHNGQE